MKETFNVTARLKAGEEIEIVDISARREELENDFDDRGFLYIAINGWLIPELDGNPEARELMLLRAVQESLGDLEKGRVVLHTKDDETDGESFISELDGRYVPDGYLYSVTAPNETAEASEDRSQSM